MPSPVKNTFGLDIRDSALTAVEMAWAGNGPKWINASRIELEPGIVEDDSIVVNPAAFKEALGRLLKEGGMGPIHSRNAVIGVPDSKTFSHQLLFSSEEEHDRAGIEKAAKDFIPIELSEAVMDSIPSRLLPGETGRKYDCVAVHKNFIDSMLSVLGEAGLTVVAVDEDKNALIRCFQAEASGAPAEPFLIAHIDYKSVLLIISSPSGARQTLEVQHAGREWIELIKKQYETPASAARKKLDEENIPADSKEYANVASLLHPSFQELIRKTLEWIHAVQSRESMELGSIRLLGPFSRTPGLSEAFKSAFSAADVRQGFGAMSMGRETGRHYARAIGLALRMILPAALGARDANLLPEERKAALNVLRQTPVLKKSFAGAAFVLGILATLSGIAMTAEYIHLQVSRQTLLVSEESIKNPYLNQIFQASRQKIQTEGRIQSLLKDAAPAGLLMESLNAYNQKGIALVNADYQLDALGQSVARLRAKAGSREDTEKFIMDLEGNPYFAKIISPLTNLVGKGERFVSIEMNVRTQELLKEAKP